MARRARRDRAGALGAGRFAATFKDEALREFAMLGRLTATVAVVALLAGCGGFQSAGRNARDAAPPPPAASAPAQAPAYTPAPAQTPAPPAPSVAAPNVSAPQPSPAPRRESASGGDIVVPGQVERQVPAPDGDPRSVAERAADIRAWDRCVMQVQGAAGGDPTRVQLDSPEEVCRGELGMSNRNAVPNSRR